MCNNLTLVKNYFSHIYFKAFQEEGKHEKASEKTNNFSKFVYIKYIKKSN